MQLKNCPECGKVFVMTPAGVCPDCFRRQEEDEEKVTRFLRDKDNASIDEIHDATGVPHKVILRMIQRGRISSAQNVSYKCEACGALITQGRVCAKCSSSILKQVQNPGQKDKDKEDAKRHGARMYSKDY